MTLGEVSVSQADPANDDFYTGTDFQLNGSRIDTSLDDDPFNPPVIFNTGFDGAETAESDSTYRAITFTPQGYGAPVTGLLEITVGPSAGAVGDDPFRTISFTHPIKATPADDLTATYRWSTDLLTFTPDGDPFDGTTVIFEVVDVTDGVATVEATITGTGTDKLFVDVQVTQP